MRKLLALVAIAMVLMVPALPALAADTPAQGNAITTDGSRFWVFPEAKTGAIIGATIGVGLVVIGGAKGVGAIGSHAVDAIARQPEAGGRIFTTMIISAALIEGFTLFAVVVCLLGVL